MKPFSVSFLGILGIVFFQRMHAVILFIPILVQQTDKQLFHGHLPNTIHIQFWKHACDIIQQNPVASYNIEVFRSEIVSVIV